MSTTAERVCARPGCGVRFTPKTARRIYCSDSCRAQVSKRSVSKSLDSVVVVKAPVIATATAAAIWEPPSVPVGLSVSADACPRCAGPLTSSPRGTLRSCPPCGGRAIPPHVAELYARDTPATTRKVRSDRERDDDAKAVVVAAGQFLRRITELLADERLHPDSRELLGWYADEIAAAKSKRAGQRVVDLADEFADDQDAGRFHRRSWWGGRGAAITAGTVVDDDEPDDDQDAEEDDEPAAILAVPVPETRQQPAPVRATDADALALLGYRLDRTAAGCAVTDRNGRNCGQPIGGFPPVTDASGRGGRVCPPHYNELGRAIAAVNRNRGIQ